MTTTGPWNWKPFHLINERRKYRQAFSTWVGRVGLTLLILCSHAHLLKADPAGDSIRTVLNINPRIHSSGFFPFSGAILPASPVADLNIFMEKRRWGFFLFQSLDLKESHAVVNYLQPGLFAVFRPTPKLKIRTHFGYIFNQTQGFKDNDSDYFSGLQINWSLRPDLRIENSTLYYDWNVRSKMAHRLLVEYSKPRWRASGYVWYRKVFADSDGALSAAMAITWPIVRINTKSNLEFTTTYMGYVSDYLPSFARRSGVFFSVAVPIDVIR